MEKTKYKEYQAMRESNPAFILNQIGKIAFNRAKAGKRYQYLDIIISQLMCAFSMEAALNHLGKKLFEYWEEVERDLKFDTKLLIIARHIGFDISRGLEPFQLLSEIIGFRNNLVHAKSSKHPAKEIHQNEIGEDGFPIVNRIPELLTDWEKLCSIDTAEKWLKAVDRMSSELSEAAKYQNPIKIGGIVDTWGVIET